MSPSNGIMVGTKRALLGLRNMVRQSRKRGFRMPATLSFFATD